MTKKRFLWGPYSGVMSKGCNWINSHFLKFFSFTILFSHTSGKSVFPFAILWFSFGWEGKLTIANEPRPSASQQTNEKPVKVHRLKVIPNFILVLRLKQESLEINEMHSNNASLLFLGNKKLTEISWII